MRNYFITALEFLLVFLVSPIVGIIVVFISSILHLSIDVENMLMYIAAFILLGVFLYRLTKRHQLNQIIFATAIPIVFILSSLIPDKAPSTIHTAKYEYTFGVPLPFITVHSESNASFLLQHVSFHHSFGINAFPFLLNVIIVYFVMMYIRKVFVRRHKPISISS
ncbi:hypothetical protein SH601_11565 [Gracilibacillus sp. S3-1-1]|uniref:Uncharacterized protein n=1 Tax=Gracilibacillus pellucidus TaxID=3095368 RepID=A0ACC6M6L0_9BACI|nr:hypothetical protein [Gracilibacillus sp. S3-1-1]MDX8046620.1 hypothetical protein [Gracilibacillus sp. S3-1-1]